MLSPTIGSIIIYVVDEAMVSSVFSALAIDIYLLLVTFHPHPRFCCSRGHDLVDDCWRR